MFSQQPLFLTLREANYYLLSIVTSSVMNNLDAFSFKDLILFLFK